MHRRTLLRASAGIGIVGLSGCAGQGARSDFTEGFEDGLGEWERNATIGPEVDIEDFEWEVDISERQAAEGDRSVRVWNEGDYDDGVTWVSHSISIQPGQAYDIVGRGQFWSESESFNTLRHAMMRLGPDPATVEDDFPQLGVNSSDFGDTPIGGLREPLWLAEGWREYRFEWTTPALSTDILHFAVGTAVIWEGDATHYVDDLSVSIELR
jgi:hypothetical protein